MLYLFKNGANFFKKRQVDILSAAFVIAASVALSRLLGLVRYRLLASYFGEQINLLDSYIAASILPEAIFEVLIFGTIALAFIPVFSQYLSKSKLKTAWEFSSTMITLGILVFLAFAVVVMVLADYIAPLIAPGIIAKDPSSRILIARLLRIMIFAQFFFVISIFLTGILQSFQRFIVPALASVFYNIGIILSIIFLVPVFGIYAPAIGMIIGALLHLVVQLPLTLSLGFKFRFTLDIKRKDVLDTISLMWPRSLALLLTRISDIINIALASIAAIGSIVAFNFAQVLQFVPIALFAGSISQAALPSLAIQYNTKSQKQFKNIFIQSFHQILFLILPSAAILAILRIPTVRLVFGAKEFPWEATVLTGRVLIAFSVGIVAQASSLLLTRGFYALRDSITPVKVNIVTFTLNILLSLSFILIFHLSIVYLAVAYSTAYIFNAILLLYLLDKKVQFEKKALIWPAFKMIVISLITAISLYIPMKLLDQLVFDTTKTVNLILLTGIATIVGLAVYLTLCWIFRVEQIYIFAKFAKRIISIPSKFSSPAPTSIDAQQQNP